MSGLTDLANSTGQGLAGGIAGAVGTQLGYGLGQVTGYNNSLDRRQERQQQKLTDIQYNANYNLMKNSYAEQKALWDATNSEAQVKHLQAAGLNPALMYAKGGAGGSTGGGGASVGGASASDSSSRQAAANQQSIAGLGMMKLQSEIKLNEAQATKLNAEAKTTEGSRDSLLSKLHQEGESVWLDNIRKRYQNIMGKDSDPYHNETYKNEQYGQATIYRNSIFNELDISKINQALSSSLSSEAQAKLTDEKTKGYWQELLNDTARANSSQIQAAAIKLAAEFNYGEEANWKYWAQLARGVTKDIIGVIMP